MPFFRKARYASGRLFEVRADQTNEVFCQLHRRHHALFVAQYVRALARLTVSSKACRVAPYSSLERLQSDRSISSRSSSSFKAATKNAAVSARGPVFSPAFAIALVDRRCLRQNNKPQTTSITALAPSTHRSIPDDAAKFPEVVTTSELFAP
jgi:hypothetical protein